jgi:hypothetical protein
VIAYDFSKNADDRLLEQTIQQQNSQRYYGLAVLEVFAGVPTFRVKADQIERFFDCDDNKYSPFSRGGTYILNIPEHLMAVHYDTDGEMIFYDPNEYDYIHSSDDLEAYKKHFSFHIIDRHMTQTGGFLGVASALKELCWLAVNSYPQASLPVSVLPVRLRDKAIAQRDLVDREKDIAIKLQDVTYQYLRDLPDKNHDIYLWGNLFSLSVEKFTEMLQEIVPGPDKFLSFEPIMAFERHNNEELFDIYFKKCEVSASFLAYWEMHVNKKESYERYGAHVFNYFVRNTPERFLPQNIGGKNYYLCPIFQHITEILNHFIDLKAEGVPQSTIMALFDRVRVEQAITLLEEHQALPEVIELAKNCCHQYEQSQQAAIIKNPAMVLSQKEQHSSDAALKRAAKK